MKKLTIGTLTMFAVIFVPAFSMAQTSVPGTVTPIVYGGTAVTPVDTAPKPAQFSVDAPTPKKQATSVLSTLSSLGNKQARAYCGSSRFRMLAATINLGLVNKGYVGNGNYTVECTR